MTSAGTIDYEALTQAALRQVLRGVLRQTEQFGLPGEHHFYISFDTQADGVVLSERLRAKYPHEMTIVLQHRFWDLSVGEEQFEVKLTFDGVPERLIVPFAAIRVFFDPSVRYAIQFNGGEQTGHHDGDMSADHADEAPETPRGGGLMPVTPRPLAAVPSAPAPLRPIELATSTADHDDDAVGDDAGGDEAHNPGDEAADDRRETEAETTSGDRDDQASEDDDDAAPQAGVVISLDAFRKK